MLRVDGLSIGYNKEKVASDLTFSLEKGSLAALVGPNGVGKSTLLKTLMGLMPPLQGHIEKSFKRVSYLPQKHLLDHTFPFLVKDVVRMGLFQKQDHREKHIQKALMKVDLHHLQNAPIRTLSGGQWQRMLFARLILEEGDLILLDEPLDGVDHKTQSIILHLLKNWSKAGKSIVCVLHDFSCVKDHFPVTYLLSSKSMMCGKTHEVLSDENLIGVAYSV
jgi:zinc/manganese transport system ATP-binding protein